MAAVERFDRAGAWCRVGGAEQLASVWGRWLAAAEESPAEGRRAAELVAANRGALERTVRMLQPILGDTTEG